MLVVKRTGKHNAQVVISYIEILNPFYFSKLNDFLFFSEGPKYMLHWITEVVRVIAFKTLTM